MGKWEMVPFDIAISDETKNGTKIMKENYLQNGRYPIIDQGKELIAGYSNKKDGIYENIPAIIFGDHTRVVKYIDMPFFLGADGVKLLKSKISEIDYKYLYYYLTTERIPNTGYNRHFKWLKEVCIPLPPLEVQRQIADVLDRASALIEKRKAQIEKLDLLVKSRFIEMFGDPVTNPKGWGRKSLKTVISRANNGMARRGNDESGNIVLRLVELQDGYIDYSNPNRIFLRDDEKKRYLLHENDFLFARVNGNPEYVGRCAVFHDIHEDVYHNDHIIRVHFDETRLDGNFASVLLNSAYGKRQMKSQIKTSAGQYTINQDGIGAIEVILPPLSIQNEFADFVHQIKMQKQLLQHSLTKLELNYKSLIQKCFRDEIF